MREVPNELFLYPRALIYMTHFAYDFTDEKMTRLDVMPNNVLNTIDTLKTINNFAGLIFDQFYNPNYGPNNVTFGTEWEYLPFHITSYINNGSTKALDKIPKEQIKIIKNYVSNTYMIRNGKRVFNKNILFSLIEELDITQVKRNKNSCSYKQIKDSFWRFVKQQQKYTTNDTIDFSLYDYQKSNPPQKHWILLFILRMHVDKKIEILTFSPNKKLNEFTTKLKIIDNPDNIIVSNTAQEVILNVSTKKRILTINIKYSDNTPKNIEIGLSETEIKFLLCFKKYFCQVLLGLC